MVVDEAVLSEQALRAALDHADLAWELGAVEATHAILGSGSGICHTPVHVLSVHPDVWVAC